ncbi:hypothetical protein HRbin23_00393 [bacterium HR23]|nr:hypothetical protein HRbin23_00393 [bacterium HR23]
MARLPYITRREDLPPEHRGAWDAISAKRGHVARPFQVLLHSPPLATRVASIGEYARFITGALDGVTRELAILATTRYWRAQYPFTHHVHLARLAGVREEAIQAIKKGVAPRGLTPVEALPVRFAQSLLRRRQVSDALWQEALQRLGTQGVIDLTVTIGYYTLLSLWMLAVQVELEPDMATELPQR